MIRGMRVAIVTCVACCSWIHASARVVRAWEDTITIPTYRMGPEDVNPRFFDYEGKIYYPYTEQEHLTTIKEDVTYKALYLENEFLKLVCLPELGGKIYSVLDKTTGEEMFYKNGVIKPGLIAMRGAWISGGIEWNAGPTGHGVTSYSPVDATYVKNKDGSATLVIGDTEHSTRTRWTVWLTLRPNRSYLDQRIRIENPTDSVQTFYFWNNTAFPNNEGTRFIYPMTLGTDHNGTEFFSWPIHEGKDLTWLKNYDRPTSVFAYRCAFDFFGAYEVDMDRGIVQVANHHELIGKKAWTWGNSDDGLVSQSRLTDDDGPYIEVQSGPLETQADFGLLGPQQHIEWQEWWYPVHGLGQGFEFATKDVAVETIWTKSAAGNALEVRLLTTAEFRDLSCYVAPAGVPESRELEIAAIEVAKATPKSAIVHRFEMQQYEAAAIRIEDGAGHILASFETPLPIPAMTPPVLSEPTQVTHAEAYVMAGVDAEKENRRNRAREQYESALNADPGHAEANLRLAILDIEAAQYDSARRRLEVAIERKPEHGMAWYYMGVAWLGEDWQRGGDATCLNAALNAAHQAAQDLDAAALGHDLLGRVYMRQQKYSDALHAFEESIARAPHSQNAKEHRMVALAALGRRDAAVSAARALVAEDSLRILPLAVLAELREATWPETAQRILDQTGEDSFALLEAAYAAADLGLSRGAPTLAQALAVNLLRTSASAPGSRIASDPMVHLAIAYLDPAPGSANRIARAASALPDYVFPSRPESIPVLRHAMNDAASGSAGAFHLYLGNLYAGLGRLDEAVAAWEQAVTLDDSLSVAHRNLGMHAWKKDSDLAKAAAQYEKALAQRPEDQLLYRDLAAIWIAQDKRSEAIALLERSPELPSRRGDLTTLLAQAYLDTNDYDATLALLAAKSFSNWEGNATTWNIYRRAHLARGEQRLEAGDAAGALDDFEASLEYPDNLGVGRPADPEEAESYYWKGRALQALGRTDDARNAFQAGAASRAGSTNQIEYQTRAQEALTAL